MTDFGFSSHRAASRRLTAALRASCAAGFVALALAGCSKKEGPADPPVQAAAPPRDALLQEGDPAPDFEAVAHDGQTVKLSNLRGKIVVLYFYPKDGTPGCTTEAQAFRDEAVAFQKSEVVVLGVSADDNESHRAFAQEHGLPFLLLPDTERSLARAYGVGSFLGMSKRVTFLVDKEGKIARVYPSVEPEKHAAEILSDVEKLK